MVVNSVWQTLYQLSYLPSVPTFLRVLYISQTGQKAAMPLRQPLALVNFWLSSSLHWSTAGAPTLFSDTVVCRVLAPSLSPPSLLHSFGMPAL